MTTYNDAAVSDASIAFQKPITLQQGRALRNNPIAGFEGANGSPYTAAGWHPYDGVTVGDGADGVIYDFAVDGAIASVETPNFVDGYEYEIRFSALVPSTGAPDLRVEFYMETSAAYAGTTVVEAAIGTGAPVSGYIGPFIPRASSRLFRFMFCADTAGSNTITTFTVDNILIKHSTAQKILKARISTSTLALGGGKIYLFKRRSYVEA